jgi:hypothetical protein
MLFVFAYLKEPSNYQNNAHIMNNNDRWDSGEDTKVGCLELFENNDGNGIIFSPMCKGDGDEKCFTSSNEAV